MVKRVKIAGQPQYKPKQVQVSSYTTKHGRKVNSYKARRWLRKQGKRIRKVILPEHSTVELERRRKGVSRKKRIAAKRAGRASAEARRRKKAMEQLWEDRERLEEKQLGIEKRIQEQFALAEVRVTREEKEKREREIEDLWAEREKLEENQLAIEKTIQEQFAQAAIREELREVVPPVPPALPPRRELTEAEITQALGEMIEEQRVSEARRRVEERIARDAANAAAQEEAYTQSLRATIIERERERAKDRYKDEDRKLREIEDLALAKGEFSEAVLNQKKQEVENIRTIVESTNDQLERSLKRADVAPSSEFDPSDQRRERDLHEAQVKSLDDEYQKRINRINRLQLQLSATTPSTTRYKRILNALAQDDDRALRDADVHLEEKPEGMKQRIWRKFNRQEKQEYRDFETIGRASVQLEHLDHMLNQANEAEKRGTWTEQEVITLKRQIHRTRHAIFNRIQQKYPVGINMKEMTDRDLDKLIHEYTVAETLAKKYQKTNVLGNLPKQIGNVRNTIESEKLARITIENRNRLKAVNDLTDYFNENKAARQFDTAIVNKDVQKRWRDVTGISEKRLDGDVEQGKFKSDVSRAIINSVAITGDESREVKGLRQSYEEALRERQPDLSNRQVQEWMQQFPEIQWHAAQMLKEEKLADEYRVHGATATLTALSEEEIARARPVITRERPDLTLGLFKHHDKKKKSHTRSKKRKK